MKDPLRMEQRRSRAVSMQKTSWTAQDACLHDMGVDLVDDGEMLSTSGAVKVPRGGMQEGESTLLDYEKIWRTWNKERLWKLKKVQMWHGDAGPRMW